MADSKLQKQVDTLESYIAQVLNNIQRNSGVRFQSLVDFRAELEAKEDKEARPS